jgi:hypothetical protein
MITAIVNRLSFLLFLRRGGYPLAGPGNGRGRMRPPPCRSPPADP